jgi:phosphoglycerol transferase MdoB-like AlkP superfamily enzyme
MKQRIILFFSIFFYFVLIFFVGKVAFTLIHSSIGGGVSATDIFQVLYHGLPLDISMSGYLTVIPALAIIASIWFKPKFIARTLSVYFGIIFAIIAIITVVDIIVYPYLGFHLDSTVFLYLKNPKETFAGAPVSEIIAGVLFAITFVVIVYTGYIFIIQKQELDLKVPKSIWKTRAITILLAAALFLPVRGGITVSTMNIGQVYYSDNMFLNHAAINPAFNMVYSFTKSGDFASQYQFYRKQEATYIFDEITKQPHNDSIPQLLNTDRPNIILFILESFSADVALDSVVAPNMCGFAKEGVFFENFYANSFRTDRGLVSVLSGYPAHPTVAIMEYPQKTSSLPAIPRTLRQVGYNLSFYYGSDADFANMRSYFVGACGIKDIVDDKEFPLSERMTKWGVPDKLLIERFYKDLTAKKENEPFFKTVLTLSSREPFDVPVGKFKEPFLNAVSYTDECLGIFVKQLKSTEYWNNTLIIFIADHAMQSYPQGVSNSDPERFHIPMIWIGGAVNKPEAVKDYGSQNDLAATLLSQLKIKYEGFRFSKDMLNPDGNKFAFYSYVNGFCMTDYTGTVTYDNDKQRVIKEEGNPELEKKAKAFFQMMYLDMGSR